MNRAFCQLDASEDSYGWVAGPCSMSVSAHIVGDMTENRSFLDRPKPWLDAPRPGPTVVVDIDGVVADMHNFEGLIAAPSYADRDWKRFHTHFGEASLNRAGGKLVRALDSAGFTIAYSTTRLDQFNRTSDRWIRAKSLPPGHIESRSLCQWPRSSPRRRPVVLPAGGHGFSPVAASCFSPPAF